MSAMPVQHSREPGFYLSIDQGLLLPANQNGEISSPGLPGVDFKIKRKAGYNMRAGIGYAFANNMRLQFDYGYAVQKLDYFDSLGFKANYPFDQKYVSHRISLEVAYDLFISQKVFIPFSGRANLNFSRQEIFFDDDSFTEFGLDFGTGIGYQFTPRIALIMGYDVGFIKTSGISETFIIPLEFEPDIMLTHGFKARLMVFF